MRETLHKRNKQKFIDIDYLLYKPNSYEQNPQNSYPLIVFLHGGSIEDNEFEALKEKGINQYIKDGNELESIVVSPLHYDPDKFWSEQIVLAIIEEIVEKSLKNNRKMVWACRGIIFRQFFDDFSTISGGPPGKKSKPIF